MATTSSQLERLGNSNDASSSAEGETEGTRSSAAAAFSSFDAEEE